MKNKFLTALLSAAVALGLWVYVVTMVSPNSEKTFYNIPVTIELSEDMMLVSQQPVITLKLSGNRTNLNRMDENNINVVAEASHLTGAVTDSVKFRVEYPFGMTSNEITLLDSSMDLIQVKVDNKLTKPVPVTLEPVGSASPGFISDTENPVLEVDTVEVTGPATVVSQITQAKVIVNLEGKSQNVSGKFSYLLCDEEGNVVQTDPELVVTNVETVGVTVQILQVKEITLSLNKIFGAGTNENNTSIVISPQTIEVSGSDEALANLDQIILGQIDLTQILKNETLTFPIVLPEGVNNETGVPEATVTIQLPELAVKKLNVSNIQVINAPAGMKADMITQLLEVTIRGDKRLIDAIEAENVTIIVDLSGKTAGTQKIRPIITVDEQFAGVGAIGTYTVSVTIAPEG